MKLRSGAVVTGLTFGLISGVLGCCAANAAVLDFDNLKFSGISDVISSGYEGFGWNNFGVLNAPALQASYGVSGYTYGNISSPNVAFNESGSPASITRSTSFSVSSMYITSAWHDGLSVTFFGSLAGSQLYSSTYVINSEDPTFITLNFANIDTLSFVTSGGTNPGYTAGDGTQVAIDNLSYNVNSVPLPASAPMFGAALFGLAGLGYVAKRKRAAAAA